MPLQFLVSYPQDRLLNWGNRHLLRKFIDSKSNRFTPCHNLLFSALICAVAATPRRTQQPMVPSLPFGDIKAVICDMDGVVYRGKQPLPAMQEFFAFLWEQSIPFTFATNNS
ncbi:MAG: hypothetical protein KC496_21190, partial [Anaerolineae bacterium]|nr:hypothetical protein [Anaerolineae bacterium]